MVELRLLCCSVAVSWGHSSAGVQAEAWGGDCVERIVRRY